MRELVEYDPVERRMADYERKRIMQEMRCANCPRPECLAHMETVILKLEKIVA
jgi:hypothetical protein